MPNGVDFFVLVFLFPGVVAGKCSGHQVVPGTAMTIKIFTIAHVPHQLMQQWLQHLRDFDTANPGCHFEVCIDGPPDATMQEMVQELQVTPNLTFQQIFERKRQ